MAAKRETSGQDILLAKPYVKGYNLGALAGKGSFGSVFRATKIVSFVCLGTSFVSSTWLIVFKISPRVQCKRSQ